MPTRSVAREQLPRGRYIMGSMIRFRPIDLVLDRLLEFKDSRQAHYAKVFNPWWEQRTPFFWGIRKFEKKVTVESPRIMLFHTDTEGYNYDYVDKSDVSKMVMLVEHEQLPLLMTKPEYKKVTDIIAKRFRGELEAYPKRQDLIDGYAKYEKRRERQWRVYELYLELLKRWLSDKYGEQIYSPRIGKKVIIIKHRERVLYLVKESEWKLIEDDDIMELEPGGLNEKADRG